MRCSFMTRRPARLLRVVWMRNLLREMMRSVEPRATRSRKPRISSSPNMRPGNAVQAVTLTVFRSFLAITASSVLAACASTTFTDSWKAPDQAALDPRGQKVAAVFISMDEASRRAAEDELVLKLAEHGANGVATYSLIPSDELRDMVRVKERLAAAGVDGIVTLRVIDEKQQTSINYGFPQPAFQPYY